MNHKDLLKQYVDTGLAIGRTQFDKLTDGLKVTYLRKRMIAANLDDDDSLSAYEVLGVPDSYRSEMVVYLLNKMQEFFETSASLSDVGMSYDYGDVNPIVKKILKSSVWDSRIDNIIIDLSHDKTFMKYLNRKTLDKIMLNVVNPTRVFSAFGSIGENFKKNKLRSIEKVVEDVVYSNNPEALMDFLGKDALVKYFNEMEPNKKAYKLSNSNNPKAMLPILGYETMDYIKQAIKGGENNLIHHLLNNANNNYDMERLFDQYGIEHKHVDKYYDRRGMQ
jgi:hypothetical protein